MTRQKAQSEETEQKQTGMAAMLQWSDYEFKVTMMNMVKILSDKVGYVQERMDKVSRKKEILRKKQKEMLEIKKAVTEIKNVFDERTRLHMIKNFWTSG